MTQERRPSPSQGPFGFTLREIVFLFGLIAVLIIGLFPARWFVLRGREESNSFGPSLATDGPTLIADATLSPTPMPEESTNTPTSSPASTSTHTPTSIPTETSSSTPTITPTNIPSHIPPPTLTRTGVLTAITTLRVYVLSGPGTDYMWITNIAAGKSITISQRIEGGDWVEIELSDNKNYETGWVSVKSIEIARGNLNSLPIATELPQKPWPCPIKINSPRDHFRFTNADEAILRWSSGQLSFIDSYRISFRDLDNKEIEALITRNNFSVKSRGLPAWPRDNGEWLAHVRENGDYKWTVGVVRGQTLLCEAEETRIISWRLP